MEPSREEVDAMRGAVVLELGASWCPHCQVARPLVDAEVARLVRPRTAREVAEAFARL